MRLILSVLFLASFSLMAQLKVIRDPKVSEIIARLATNDEKAQDEIQEEIKNLEVSPDVSVPQLLEVVRLGAYPLTNLKDYITMGSLVPTSPQLDGQLTRFSSAYKNYNSPWVYKFYYGWSRYNAYKGLVKMGDKAVPQLIHIAQDNDVISLERALAQNILKSMVEEKTISVDNQKKIEHLQINNK